MSHLRALMTASKGVPHPIGGLIFFQHLFAVSRCFRNMAGFEDGLCSEFPDHVFVFHDEDSSVCGAQEPGASACVL